MRKKWKRNDWEKDWANLMELQRYQTASGDLPFDQWFEALRDGLAKAKILARLTRLAAGNPGDSKTIGNGVLELRIDHGPGYRVYYALAGQTLILLLCGGDKATQSQDINTAKNYWADFKRRS